MISRRIALQACLAGVALACVTANSGLAQTSDRYIVKFRPGRAAAGTSAVRAAGGQVVVTLGPQEAVAVRIPAAALNGLSRNPNVEFVEEDAVREPLAFANATAGGETLPYGIQMVEANLVSSTNAAARKICIIDSGYSQQHEDLKDDVTAKETDPGSGTWNKDSCGHGTHVAGTIAAIGGNGVGVVGANPGVSLHIVKVFGNDDLNGGACGWTYSSNLVNALNQCTLNGANVVSMSLGGSVKSRTEENAFKAAYANNVLSIAAAGNGGNTRVSYPAGYASVVSVAALDASETLAAFSQRNADVELAAPGVSVLSTVPYKDINTLTADSTTWAGGRIDGTPRTAGTLGGIVDGGRCTAPGAWAGRVVLCERGDISFADKVGSVQAGGGVAAVIYNNVASDATCGVFGGTLGDRPRTTIPATTLSCADGASARSHQGSNGDVVSQLSAPESGYEAFDGTSMATPHVSAVAALVWSCNTGLTAADVRQVLDATAKDEGAAGRDASFGFGLVRAKAAVDSLKSQGKNVHCQ